MYQDFECSVEVHKEYTPWFNVKSGVKQGCLLSPALFSLFVNDLLKGYEACELGVRCDDFSVPAVPMQMILYFWLLTQGTYKN